MRIATRGSDLALAQARWVADRLSDAHDGLECEIVEITTTGDRDRTSPVARLTEVGAFVRAVQHAVLDGRADIAVHSAKDLPVGGPPDLRTVVPSREAPWDVLCGSTLDDLRPGATIGTGSPRRRAQLLALRPDLDVVDIRGNVDTRLGKVDDGTVDAVVLAEAGLRRLGEDGRIDHRFTLEEMVPAPGQAALAVEALDGGDSLELLGAIEDPEAADAVRAERAVLRRTGAGCRSALGALGSAADGSISLVGFVEDEGGRRRAAATGPDPETAAAALADSMGLA